MASSTYILKEERKKGTVTILHFFCQLSFLLSHTTKEKGEGDESVKRDTHRVISLVPKCSLKSLGKRMKRLNG